mgnify:CR=1 FL=1
MFHSKKRYFTVALIALLMALTTVPAFAANGDGTGGGNGDRRDIAMTLTSASIRDGDTVIAVNETIQLNFNKNICHVAVLANNKQCFHLTDASGQAVAIRLIFPDTQVQKDYKHEVFIQPVEDLKPNTDYRLTVDSTLAAHNGTVIDNAHIIHFTTGTQRTDAENKVLKELDDYIITYETASGENENSIPVNKDGLDDPAEETGLDTGSIAKIAAAAFIVILIAFTAICLILKRRK